MTDPILAPVATLTAGSPIQHAVITPEIQAQILAPLAGRLDALRTSTDTLLIEMAKRVEALEKWRKRHQPVEVIPTDGIHIGEADRGTHPAPVDAGPGPADPPPKNEQVLLYPKDGTPISGAPFRGYRQITQGYVNCAAVIGNDKRSMYVHDGWVKSWEKLPEGYDDPAPVDAGPADVWQGAALSESRKANATPPADDAGPALCVPDTADNHREYTPPADDAAVVRGLFAKTGAGTYSGAMQDIINRQDAEIAALRAEVERLTRERDEARADADAIALHHEAANKDKCHYQARVAELEAQQQADALELYKHRTRGDGACAERDQLKAEVERLTRALTTVSDEAREDQNNLKARVAELEATRELHHNTLRQKNAEIERLHRENIEAQAERDRLAAELAEARSSLEAQRASNERARKRYDYAHPAEAGKWPDRTDMVLWLMKEYDDMAKERIAAKADAVGLREHGCAMESERDEARAELAALKGRKVKLPLMYGEPNKGDPPDMAHGWKMHDDAIEACADAIRAAGVEVES
jgi:predicted  nucleic acid-binding Zn-ribbon protein